MSTWSPVSGSELRAILTSAEAQLIIDAKACWQRIRLPEPQKWPMHNNACSAENDPNGLLIWEGKVAHFWVVAVFTQANTAYCIYFNDIEDGFEFSPYTVWGEIHQYNCEEYELHHCIHRILSGSV